MTRIEKTEIKGLIRKFLIARDGERCLRCARPDRLQASHIYSVGAHKKLEFDWDNIILLCFRCHIHWWHKEPVDAAEWVKTVVPQERLDRLKLRTQQTGKGMRDFKTLKVMLLQLIKNQPVSWLN